MAMKQELYAQVVMLSPKYQQITEVNKIENKYTFNFHGHSTRSQRWLYIGFYWIERNFSTREPDFYKEIFQRHD